MYFTRKQGDGGWGGVGMVTLMHLHTCEMLRNSWAGVGMMTFMHLHTCEMLRNSWAGVGMMTFMHLHTQQTRKAAKKNVSFALWKTNSFCRATRNYMQFCNRMCLLVTGTWRRRDLVYMYIMCWIYPPPRMQSSPPG